MKIIAKLCDEIETLLRQADDYIECANHKKEEFPAIAEMYYKLSEERMNDQALVHAQVVSLIETYKKEKGEEPENMKFLYNYLHEKFIDWASRIKVKQNMFKSNV